MPIPVGYSIKNVWMRSRTVIFTIGGIALVVFVFTAVQMLTLGIRTTLVGTGSEENGIAVQRSAISETSSSLQRGDYNLLKTLPGIAPGADGLPLACGETVVLVTQPKRGTGAKVNAVFRGTELKVMELRPTVKLTSGRMFTPGTSEIIIGGGVERLFENCSIGNTVTFNQRKWTIVGVFEAGRSGFDSEIWGDVLQVQQAFRRDIYSSFTFRASGDAALQAFQAEIAKDNRLRVDVKREKKFYADQSENLTLFIGVLGTMVSAIFSVGAVVGAMITMYAAVANRTREIGTLQAIGYQRWEIVMSFLLEAEAIAVIGGAIGIAAAAILTVVSFSTTNFDSFSETEFRFSLDGGVILTSLIFAAVMGFLGGVLPALQASRMKIVDALRSL